MPAETLITASCVISRERIWKNGSLFFEANDTNAAGFLAAAYRHLALSYPRFFKMDDLSKLGWLATEILLQKSFDSTRYQPEQVGLVFSNTSSSLDADFKYFESVKTIPSPALFVYTLPNIVIGEICIKHKFKGESAFFIFDSFDAAFTQQYVSGLMNENGLEACICGWVELLWDKYKSVLFLVEKGKVPDKPDDTIPMEFTKENLQNIYRFDNG